MTEKRTPPEGLPEDLPQSPKLEDQGQMGPESSNLEGEGQGTGQGEGQGAGGAEGEPAEPDPLAVAERERDEYLDALRRERAEFENFRKRVTKERMDALDRGAEQLVTNLLGVLDSFELALEAAEKSGDEQLHKGVEMVYAQLVNGLMGAGLERIAETGVTFDPVVHEAMLQVEAAGVLGHEVDEPVVAEVLRPGYRFKGRVLRPASVKVAH